MGRLRLKLDEAKDAQNRQGKPPRFAPAGQSTQMIVGADAANDQTILATSANLYGAYRLKRVYYSAFSPIPDCSRALPLAAPPLMREHRLYQADWLMRFYGFEVGEITEGGGMLPLDIDPKLAWALRHRDRFPVDVAAPAARSCCACPASAARPSTASSRRAASPRSAPPISAACTFPAEGVAVHRAGRSSPRARTARCGEPRAAIQAEGALRQQTARLCAQRSDPPSHAERVESCTIILEHETDFDGWRRPRAAWRSPA